MVEAPRFTVVTRTILQYSFSALAALARVSGNGYVFPRANAIGIHSARSRAEGSCSVAIRSNSRWCVTKFIDPRSSRLPDLQVTHLQQIRSRVPRTRVWFVAPEIPCATP